MNTFSDRLQKAMVDIRKVTQAELAMKLGFRNQLSGVLLLAKPTQHVIG
jgi:hypothetical protein